MSRVSNRVCFHFFCRPFLVKGFPSSDSKARQRRPPPRLPKTSPATAHSNFPVRKKDRTEWGKLFLPVLSLGIALFAFVKDGDSTVLRVCLFRPIKFPVFVPKRPPTGARSLLLPGMFPLLRSSISSGSQLFFVSPLCHLDDQFTPFPLCAATADEDLIGFRVPSFSRYCSFQRPTVSV